MKTKLFLVPILLIIGLFLNCSGEKEDQINNNGKILFSANFDSSKQPQIYMMNDNGTNIKRVTNGHGYYQAAKWSWDKSLIAAFSDGGSSDQLYKDYVNIYLMDEKGFLLDSVRGGLYGDGLFVWLGSSFNICYPQTEIGLLKGYFIANYPWENDGHNHQKIIIQNDSAREDIRVFDCYPGVETRILCKYKMSEKVSVDGKLIEKFYWRFGELSTSGEILKIYSRLDKNNVMNAKYSPDGKKLAFMPDANTITIIMLTKPDQSVDIKFDKQAGYTITSFLWAPNSDDLALSLNQDPRSGIYLYKTSRMELKPIIESDTAFYFISDYRSSN